MKYYLCLCAIAKDETAADLREWIFYHLGIGVEHIILYDNASQTPILQSLQDLCQAGLVDVIPFPQHQAPQLSAYFHCLRQWASLCRWLGFIDIDEFIVPYQHEGDSASYSLRDHLACYEDFAGLALSWEIFSSGGHLQRQASTIHSYTQSLGLSGFVKSIVWPEKVLRPVSPHHFAYKDNFYCVNEDGFPVSTAVSYETGRSLRVHHYYYKSQQDYEAKIKRGLATAVPAAGTTGRTIELFYNHLQYPTRTNKQILDYAQRGEQLSGLPLSVVYQQVLSDALYPLEQAFKEIHDTSRRGEPEKARQLWQCMARYHILPPLPAGGIVWGESSTQASWNMARNPILQQFRRLWQQADTEQEYYGLYRSLAEYYRKQALDGQAEAVLTFISPDDIQQTEETA